MRTLLVVLAMAAACGCGFVGGPLPPALNIPERVTILNAHQHAGQLVIGLLVTGKTTDGLVLKRLREIELRYGPPGPSMDHWAAAATRIPIEPPQAQGYEFKAPTAGLESKDIVIAVRVIGPTGRRGQWSEPLNLHVVPVPPMPIVEAAAGPAGITLRWPAASAPPGTSWRVFRQIKGEAKAQAVALATTPEWLDAAAIEEDQNYTYQVQALVPAGKSFAESDLSKPAGLTYKDVFPPEPPAGLTAIAGVNSIELSWEPGREPDLKAYQVWRAEDSGPLVKLAEVAGDVTYSDRQVSAGKHYRYAISASDSKGNTSKPGVAIEVVAQ
ncbi:MAG: fibronectin type III domain-containing protein [Bryobacteraceae bacterium]